VAAFRRLDFVMVGQGVPLRVTGASVTPNLFAALGVRATLGRTLSPSSDQPGSPRAVVLSHQLWWSRFGGRHDVLGAPLRLDDEPYEVVGVMPAGFDFPHGAALWTSPRYRVPDPPLDMGADPATIRDFDYLSVIARLRPGTGIRAAQAEMDGLAGRVAGEPEGSRARGLEVVSLHDDVVGGSRDRLLLLVGAVGFLLLITCANVAGLLLVRASRREREVALRMALGASKLRLLRQLLIESSLLALAGGLLGALLAMWGTDALLALAPEGIPRAGEIAVNLRVLGFALLLVAATGLAFGLAPGAQVLRQDLRAATNEGAGSTARRAKARLRRGLVVGELAPSPSTTRRPRSRSP
jgi:predicted permease